MEEIIQLVTEKKGLVTLDESKLMAHFGMFGISVF